MANSTDRQVGATTGAGSYQTAGQIAGTFSAGGVQIVCPTGTAASLDYVVQRSVEFSPGIADADDWHDVGSGTVTAGGRAIVDPCAGIVIRNIRVRVKRNGAGAESAYRVNLAGVDAHR